MKGTTKTNKILLVNELVVGISIFLFSLFTIGVEAQPENKTIDIPVENGQPDNKTIDIPNRRCTTLSGI